jgi:pSer/pThr/pTyr-binding forkhead associated (FHA) protein
MACLLIVAGPNEGEYHPIGKRTLLVGRDETCTIQIGDDRVSRRHVEIRLVPDDGSFRARDLGSANGTLLNDQPLAAEAVLADGDVLTLGTTELFFSMTDFTDRHRAFRHYREKGQHDRKTVAE